MPPESLLHLEFSWGRRDVVKMGHLLELRHFPEKIMDPETNPDFLFLRFLRMWVKFRGKEKSRVWVSGMNLEKSLVLLLKKKKSKKRACSPWPLLRYCSHICIFGILWFLGRVGCWRWSLLRACSSTEKRWKLDREWMIKQMVIF